MRTLISTVLAISLLAVPALAGGPFDAFRGSHSGGGSVVPVATGKSEHTSCSMSGNPSSASLALRVYCKSANAPIDLSCDFRLSGGRVSGNCYESVNGASITFRGGLNGTTISGTGTTLVSSASISFGPRSLRLSSGNARVIRSLNVHF